jgi:hypothetical protein
VSAPSWLSNEGAGLLAASIALRSSFWKQLSAATLLLLLLLLLPCVCQGYPRLMIENRIYSSRVFRKLHLELAHRQDGLQVMHMVLFPR